VLQGKTINKLAVYADLVRIRLSIAVTLSAVTGYFIFTGKPSHHLFLLTGGVFLLAAGASALNQVSERDQDNLMRRTMTRPLPLHKISTGTALWFSLFHLLSGALILLFTGLIPALFGIINIIFYNLLYTRLKKITVLAVIPGALVGAIPPVIGFTAAGGTFFTPDILLFSGFMFLWQLPHFWLIIMKHQEDYRKAGFKTFPEHLTEKQIKNLIFLWAVCSTAVLVYFDIKDLIFTKYLTAVFIPLNILFIHQFYRMLYIWSGNRAKNGPFILINTFGLLVMLLFILNAIL
jgi:protoheme IX farnesyltransferase